MARTFTVRNDTNLQSLSSTLLDARFGGAQADAAMERLKALNPHVDPQRIAAGTVLFLPDAPGLKASVGTTPQGAPIDDFRTLLSSALSEAQSRVKAANAQRAAQRTDLAAALGSDAIRHAAANEPVLAQQVSEAQQAATGEEQGDKQAEETLATMARSALAALAQIRKLTG